MQTGNAKLPWVSFCMSTFKRPTLLQKQLSIILEQTFTDFEVVVSDNDPDCSAKEIVQNFEDNRLQYFSNVENIGMTNSFNKSISRSRGKYIVMITDDDPVVPDMLETFYNIINQNPGLGIYCGCERSGRQTDAIEKFDRFEFIFQLLHPKHTRNLLWSSCLLDAQVLKNIGGMPNYGSPHLADHAMLALCGSINGGIMINQMFSNLAEHDTNFSKTNIELYYKASVEFYNLIINSFKQNAYVQKNENALLKHLERWFITYSFALRKYYTHKMPDKQKIKMINIESQKVLALPFMAHLKMRYLMKLAIFKIKSILINLNLLK